MTLAAKNYQRINEVEMERKGTIYEKRGQVTLYLALQQPPPNLLTDGSKVYGT